MLLYVKLKRLQDFLENTTEDSVVSLRSDSNFLSSPPLHFTLPPQKIEGHGNQRTDKAKYFEKVLRNCDPNILPTEDLRHLCNPG